MRQLKSLAILLLLTMVAPLAALADSFKVSPVDLELGSTATLQFVLENTQTYYGFQAQVTLPEGLEAVKDSDNNLDITLSNRTDGGKYEVSSNVLPDGNLIMSTFSATHSPISGNSGVLAELKVKVSTDFAGGDVEVSEIYFIDKEDKDVVLASTSTPLGVKATSITLSSESVKLKANQTSTLTATVKSGETVINKTVTWKSDDAAVATVNKGVVTAVAVGETVITATCGSASATCAVKVIATPVERLSVLDADEKPLTDGATIAIHTGDNYNFTAVVTPPDATDKTVEWTTNDPSVIEFLDNEGLIHALKAGDATVTASIAGFSFTANVNVTDVTVPVTGVTLDQTTAEIKTGKTLQLKATIEPADATTKTVAWSSSDRNVATVSTTGVVTAVKAGKATITATAGGKTATCEVTITDIEVTSVTLNQTEATLTVGDNLVLEATVDPEDATVKTVTWTSSDESVATVDEDGHVSAVKAGTATITAKAGDKTATCAVTVKAKVIAVTGITLNKTTLSLTEGNTSTLTATIAPANATDKTVTWSTSDEAVATVANGVVTAIKPGTATITATSANGKTATCEVTVNAKVIAVTGITLDKRTATLTEGETLTLIATVAPDDATDKTVTWTSSNAAVATVENGVVTAVKAGTATISAKAGEKTAVCTVTVNAKVIEVTEITLDKTEATLTEGETVTLTATVAPEDATDKTVTWTSSDEAVAIVANGVVTAVKAGTATITAKAGEKTATCTVTVNAKVIEVTEITLDKTEATLIEGETVTLTATVAPADATDKTVTWTSSDETVATVENGVVTAVKAGTATISAKAGEKTATCTVTVNAKEPEQPEVPEINLDQTFNAETTLEDTDEYTWGEEIQGMITDNGIYLTNGSNAANNYEGRDFLIFTEPLGDSTHEVVLSYEVYSPKDKGQANTYYEINYYNAEGEFIFGIQEWSGGWAYGANIVTANADGTTTTTALPAGHMSKEGGSTVDITVRFADGMAIITIDGITFTAYTSSEGIKSVKLAVTGGNGYNRDMYLKNYDVTTNEVEAVKFAKYTVKYVAGGATIKEIEKNGVVGSEITILPNETENFYNEEKTVKYIYVSNDAEGKTIDAEGTTVVTLTYRVAAEYKYTVKNNVDESVLTGTSLEGESVTVTYHRYIMAEDGTVWMKAPCGGDKKLEYRYTFTPDANNFVVNLEYTATDMTDGIYFVEAENVEGMTPTSNNNADVRCSNAEGAYAAEAVEVYTLKPGTYKVRIAGMGGNATDASKNVDFIVKAGEDNTVLTATTNGSWTEFASEEFTLTEETALTVEGANSNHQLDYILITGKVIIPVTGLSILNEDDQPLDSTHSLAMVIGDEYTLTEVVSPENATDQKVTWTSSNEEVAKIVDIVEEPHQVHIDAMGEGEATITATLGSFSTSFKVTVTAPVVAVTGIKLDKTSAEMKTGETLQLNATIEPEDATSKEVTWRSSDNTIATVSTKGVVTALKAGKVTISATSNKITATCEITITDIEVTKVELDMAEATLTEGESLTLKATVSPDNATNKTVTWTSSNENVATVKNGVVTAVAEGQATITAKAGDVTATCVVTVKAAVIEVKAITLNKTTLELQLGESETLIATVAPANATDPTVTWETSDDAVATVDETGNVTAVGYGEAVITAKAGDKTAECVVKVNKTSAVELIGLDPDATVKVYDLNGTFVGESMEGLRQGTYIVRQGNAARKVRVR